MTLPEDIKQLVARCEKNDRTFEKDDMSLALKFGLTLWRRLSRLADHYERQSRNFMPHDIRGPMMAEAAIAMRHVLSDTVDTENNSGSGD